MIAWCFVGIYSSHYLNLGVLVVIHAFSDAKMAGINLSTVNISLKLEPQDKTIVYLCVENIIVAAFPPIGPSVGGTLGDLFSNHKLLVTDEWLSPYFQKSYV